MVSSRWEARDSEQSDDSGNSVSSALLPYARCVACLSAVPHCKPLQTHVIIACMAIINKLFRTD